MIEFQQAAAAIYLAAGIAALVGIVLPSARMSRGAVWGLLLGAALQGLGFVTLHRQPSPPLLTDPTSVTTLAVWMAVLCVLFFSRRMRVTSLVAVVGFVAFLIVFASLLRPVSELPASGETMGTWPHAHVLLASAGLALMGVAGLAGIFYLVEHRRLKEKRPLPRLFRGPSLEALDRINTTALAVGFPLLTLGVATGMLWQHSVNGSFWMATPHETWTLVAWVIYAGLVLVRFAGRQGARQAAATAVAGFAFLAFAVIGVGVLR